LTATPPKASPAHRQLAHANAGGVRDRIRHRCRGENGGEFADAFHTHRIDETVLLGNEDDGDAGRVGIYRIM